MSDLRYLSVLALVMARCSSPGLGSAVTDAPDSAYALDAGASSDASSDARLASGTKPSFETLGDWLDSQVSGQQLHGYALMVFGPDDTLLFESSAGRCVTQHLCPAGSPPFTVDLATRVASSSKWVVSTVALAFLEDAVEQGVVADLDSGLDRAIREWLSCPSSIDPEVSGITLRQLLSFTSGLPTQYTECAGDSDTVSCACRFLGHAAGRRVAHPTEGSPLWDSQPPGTVYKYSQTDSTVAMAVVEQNVREMWTDYFRHRVAQSAGMEKAYFSHHLVPASSLQSSARDYSAFVRTIFHDGQGAGVILSANAVRAQQADQVPTDAVVRLTPAQGYDYGLNNWRWCHRSVGADILSEDFGIVSDPPCNEIHQTGHGGKGGFMPWIDVSRGLYGVFAAREGPSSDDPADYSPAELSLTARVRLYAGLAFDAEHGDSQL